MLFEECTPQKDAVRLIWNKNDNGHLPFFRFFFHNYGQSKSYSSSCFPNPSYMIINLLDWYKYFGWSMAFFLCIHMKKKTHTHTSLDINQIDLKLTLISKRSHLRDSMGFISFKGEAFLPIPTKRLDNYSRSSFFFYFESKVVSMCCVFTGNCVCILIDWETTLVRFIIFACQC